MLPHTHVFLLSLFLQSGKMLLWKQDYHLPWSLARCHTSYCNHRRIPGSTPCLPHSLPHSSPYLLKAEVYRPVSLPFLQSCHQVLAPQSCLTLCDPMDCSPPGSVRGILQARILEWVAIASSRESSRPRDWSQVSWMQVDFLSSEPQGSPKATIKKLSELLNNFYSKGYLFPIKSLWG